MIKPMYCHVGLLLYLFSTIRATQSHSANGYYGWQISGWRDGFQRTNQMVPSQYSGIQQNWRNSEPSKHKTVFLAGYDVEIFELMDEIKKEGVKNEIKIIFYIFSHSQYYYLGSLMSDIKTLRKLLHKYHHYFKLDRHYLERYNKNNHSWYIDKLIMLPSNKDINKILNSYKEKLGSGVCLLKDPNEFAIEENDDGASERVNPNNEISNDAVHMREVDKEFDKNLEYDKTTNSDNISGANLKCYESNEPSNSYNFGKYFEYHLPKEKDMIGIPINLKVYNNVNTKVEPTPSKLGTSQENKSLSGYENYNLNKPQAISSYNYPYNVETPYYLNSRPPHHFYVHNNFADSDNRQVGLQDKNNYNINFGPYKSYKNQAFQSVCNFYNNPYKEIGTQTINANAPTSAYIQTNTKNNQMQINSRIIPNITRHRQPCGYKPFNIIYTNNNVLDEIRSMKNIYGYTNTNIYKFNDKSQASDSKATVYDVKNNNDIYKYSQNTPSAINEGTFYSNPNRNAYNNIDIKQQNYYYVPYNFDGMQNFPLTTSDKSFNFNVTSNYYNGVGTSYQSPYSKSFQIAYPSQQYYTASEIHLPENKNQQISVCTENDVKLKTQTNTSIFNKIYNKSKVYKVPGKFNINYFLPKVGPMPTNSNWYNKYHPYSKRLNYGYILNNYENTKQNNKGFYNFEYPNVYNTGYNINMAKEPIPTNVNMNAYEQPIKANIFSIYANSNRPMPKYYSPDINRNIFLNDSPKKYFQRTYSKYWNWPKMKHNVIPTNAYDKDLFYENIAKMKSKEIPKTQYLFNSPIINYGSNSIGNTDFNSLPEVPYSPNKPWSLNVNTRQILPKYDWHTFHTKTPTIIEPCRQTPPKYHSDPLIEYYSNPPFAYSITQTISNPKSWLDKFSHVFEQTSKNQYATPTKSQPTVTNYKPNVYAIKIQNAPSMVRNYTFWQKPLYPNRYKWPMSYEYQQPIAKATLPVGVSNSLTNSCSCRPCSINMISRLPLSQYYWQNKIPKTWPQYGLSALIYTEKNSYRQSKSSISQTVTPKTQLECSTSKIVDPTMSNPWAKNLNIGTNSQMILNQTPETQIQYVMPENSNKPIAFDAWPKITYTNPMYTQSKLKVTPKVQIQYNPPVCSNYKYWMKSSELNSYQWPNQYKYQSPMIEPINSSEKTLYQNYKTVEAEANIHNLTPKYSQNYDFGINTAYPVDINSDTTLNEILETNIETKEKDLSFRYTNPVVLDMKPYQTSRAWLQIPKVHILCSINIPPHKDTNPNKESWPQTMTSNIVPVVSSKPNDNYNVKLKYSNNNYQTAFKPNIYQLNEKATEDYRINNRPTLRNNFEHSQTPDATISDSNWYIYPYKGPFYMKQKTNELNYSWKNQYISKPAFKENNSWLYQYTTPYSSSKQFAPFEVSLNFTVPKIESEPTISFSNTFKESAPSVCVLPQNTFVKPVSNNYKSFEIKSPTYPFIYSQQNMGVPWNKIQFGNKMTYGNVASTKIPVIKYQPASFVSQSQFVPFYNDGSFLTDKNIVSMSDYNVPEKLNEGSLQADVAEITDQTINKAQPIYPTADAKPLHIYMPQVHKMVPNRETMPYNSVFSRNVYSKPVGYVQNTDKAYGLKDNKDIYRNGNQNLNLIPDERIISLTYNNTPTSKITSSFNAITPKYIAYSSPNNNGFKYNVPSQTTFTQNDNYSSNKDETKTYFKENVSTLIKPYQKLYPKLTSTNFPPHNYQKNQFIYDIKQQTDQNSYTRLPNMPHITNSYYKNSGTLFPKMNIDNSGLHNVNQPTHVLPALSSIQYFTNRYLNFKPQIDPKLYQNNYFQSQTKWPSSIIKDNFKTPVRSYLYQKPYYAFPKYQIEVNKINENPRADDVTKFMNVKTDNVPTDNYYFIQAPKKFDDTEFPSKLPKVATPYKLSVQKNYNNIGIINAVQPTITNIYTIKDNFYNTGTNPAVIPINTSTYKPFNLSYKLSQPYSNPIVDGISTFESDTNNNINNFHISTKNNIHHSYLNNNRLVNYMTKEAIYNPLNKNFQTALPDSTFEYKPSIYQFSSPFTDTYHKITSTVNIVQNKPCYHQSKVDNFPYTYQEVTSPGNVFKHKSSVYETKPDEYGSLRKTCLTSPFTYLDNTSPKELVENTQSFYRMPKPVEYFNYNEFTTKIPLTWLNKLEIPIDEDVKMTSSENKPSICQTTSVCSISDIQHNLIPSISTHQKVTWPKNMVEYNPNYYQNTNQATSNLKSNSFNNKLYSFSVAKNELANLNNLKTTSSENVIEYKPLFYQNQAIRREYSPSISNEYPSLPKSYSFHNQIDSNLVLSTPAAAPNISPYLNSAEVTYNSPTPTTSIYSYQSSLYPVSSTQRSTLSLSPNFNSITLPISHTYSLNNQLDLNPFSDKIKSIFNHHLNTNNFRNDLYSINKELTIPLGEIGIAKYIPDINNSFILKTDNPNIELKAWNSKLKILKAKLIIEAEDYNVLNFMPVVKDRNLDFNTIQDIAKDVVSNKYGEPIVIKGIYSFNEPYAVVCNIDNIVWNAGKCYILWPTFCNNRLYDTCCIF